MPEGIRGRPFEMSKFHCREMLYDYMAGRLDPQRREAVEKAIREDKELKEELDQYVDAAHYCEKLSQVQLSENTISDLQNIRLQTEIVAEKVRYRNWPDLLKWSSEAVVISVFVAGLAMVIPWNTIRSAFKNPPHNEVILADVEKAPATAATPVEQLPLGAKIKPGPGVPVIAPKVALGPPSDAKPAETNAPIVSVATPAPATATTTAPAPPVVAKTPAPPPPSKAVVPVVGAPLKPTAVTAMTTIPTAPPAAAPLKPRLVETPKQEVAETKPATQGMLFRILMNKSDIEALAPELANKIVALGGKKAGEVEIGWRQPGQNYFHFSIPEANYEQLLSALAAIGPSRIYKSPHPRVMPEGVMRIILTIKDGETTSPKVEEAFGEPVAPADGATPSEESTPATEE